MATFSSGCSKGIGVVGSCCRNIPPALPLRQVPQVLACLGPHHYSRGLHASLQPFVLKKFGKVDHFLSEATRMLCQRCTSRKFYHADK